MKILKLTAPSLSPTSGWSARTVTVSPGAKGRDGRKLAPLPSEWATSQPAWPPVREPVTRTPVTSPRAAPRKLTCVLGEATGVPAAG